MYLTRGPGPTGNSPETLFVGHALAGLLHTSLLLPSADQTVVPEDRPVVCQSHQVVGCNSPAHPMVVWLVGPWLNDEGKANGLPVTARATALLWVHNSLFRGRDIIMGQAFIVGPTTWRGKLLSPTKRKIIAADDVANFFPGT